MSQGNTREGSPVESCVKNISIQSHLDQNWATSSMREDVTRAFTNRPIVLPPKWLYDDKGSQIFDAITRLPDYYPTEAERALLAAHADEIVERTGATTVAELGSGTSDKTRTLLDAFHEAGQLERFVPFDVSEGTLREAAEMLAERYPGLAVDAVAGDFTLHLSHLPTEGQRMIAFLGGTLGNFYEEERRAFLGALADTLRSGESILLGVDLYKDVDRIIAAYNDETGVSEAFNKNVLAVINRELGADFDLEDFTYMPLWDPIHSRVDMRCLSLIDQTVRIEGLDLTVELSASEEIRVEISTKFRPHKIIGEVTDAGFELTELFAGNGDFGLLLATKP